ncbi:peptide chain release factor 1 [Candidatus Epulonipiscium fishelsonii]|uniref:Peptide chain release factor 1 n=1 Tax=Candidatus Epulonipiscium fishelsonii TaxID=77094 RepID=A0ACC8X7W5_9FIRM|nr:peptide chain release factor 1 [Epulopiscium sp. SCG-B11WGA-EpuloA1]ONI41136.1 peptide chain release factor 1 [Epulopiscium sp. SCG-B05WGA-EpuloA1]ONI47108.1 peptide chain release factor 1 [Epulopiscium sp. SCG-C06WGA-EpuloA1]
MFDQIEELVVKFNEIGSKINEPAVISDQETWRKLMKEHSGLQPIVDKYREYKKTLDDIDDALLMLEDDMDEDFRNLVKEELAENKKKIEPLENELKLLLIPKDPNDDKNVIVEIRGGAGGDEAALFAADLYRMYNRFSERSRWKSELMDINESGIGGFKEVIFMIKGDGAYSKLKYESGVHRVQRIPTTESGGRIHTSTVTVAVLPEAEEVDVDVNLNDIRVDVFRSSGNGGQSVNTTDSAVRITHMPTGIVVSCQDEKSQLKNKDKAMKVLRAKLYELELAKQHSELAAEKRSQIGTGDRSERIRTYNFPQGRVTDHRVGLTLHKLDQVLDGDIEEIISTLSTVDQTEKLKQATT